MKKFILCASFVTLLGEGAEATKIYNLTDLRWSCIVKGGEVNIDTNDEKNINLKLVCTTEGRKSIPPVKCESKMKHIAITEHDGSYKCGDVEK